MLLSKYKKPSKHTTLFQRPSDVHNGQMTVKSTSKQRPVEVQKSLQVATITHQQNYILMTMLKIYLQTLESSQQVGLFKEAKLDNGSSRVIDPCIRPKIFDRLRLNTWWVTINKKNSTLIQLAVGMSYINIISTDWCVNGRALATRTGGCEFEPQPSQTTVKWQSMYSAEHQAWKLRIDKPERWLVV